METPKTAWNKTCDGLPEKPGVKRYEQIPCIVVIKGYIDLLVWNCEHHCWDDSSGDDYYCEALTCTHWMPLPDLPEEFE